MMSFYEQAVFLVDFQYFNAIAAQLCLSVYGYFDVQCGVCVQFFRHRFTSSGTLKPHVKHVFLQLHVEDVCI